MLMRCVPIEVKTREAEWENRSAEGDGEEYLEADKMGKHEVRLTNCRAEVGWI